MANKNKTPVNKFDLEKNKLSIYPNKLEKKEIQEWDNLQDKKQTNIGIAKNSEGNIVGVIYHDFMDIDSMAYKGLKAEDDFKKILMQCNVPCLYVGQGVNFKERNVEIQYCDTLITIKRPDFLVSFLDLGNVLVDVKCRAKWQFQNDKVFYINYDDVDKLHVLNDYLHTPVWLAFKDYTGDDKDFYLCSIRILKQLKDNFFELSPPRITKHLRIPNEILSPLSSNVLLNPLNNFQIDAYVKQLIDLENDSSQRSRELLSDEKPQA